jgi:hypothetical protein
LLCVAAKLIDFSDHGLLKTGWVQVSVTEVGEGLCPFSRAIYLGDLINGWRTYPVFMK